MIVSVLVAGLVSLAQQAGVSIQQWIQSPTGQQCLQNIAKQLGQSVVLEIMKKLHLD